MNGCGGNAQMKDPWCNKIMRFIMIASAGIGVLT